MKKVSILALHLGYGGIEKSIVALANSICHEFDVEIISTYKLAKTSAFEIDDKVKVKYLINEVKPNREEWKMALKKKKVFTFLKETYKAIWCLFLRRKRTIRAIKDCDSDIVISTRLLFNTWVGKYGKKSIKKIGWEHNHHHGDIKYATSVVKSCKNLDTLVLVSESLKLFYKSKTKEAGYKCKCIYIPNVIDDVPDELSSLDGNKLISVGRFSREKGMPDLIDVFYLAHKKNPKLKLDLVGDGAQKNMVVDKIYEYGLEKSVMVHGFVSKEKVNNLLNNASIYLMTSFTESFGIVLIEAMSHGVPCIAFSSAEGARELIDEGENGYLIKDRDKEKMADKIIELMSDLKTRKKLGENGRNKSLDYTVDIVKNKWIKLLK